ncbi:MAG: hypothetical protein J7J28_00005 [Thaumarchaeota archaeon]|nr:hypothetical protein [Nitrososphaerota archaeon]
MALTLEVWDGSSWIDKTGACVSLRRQIRSNGLEELDGELVRDAVSVGQEIRLKEDGQIVFEGVVYEVDRRHRGRDVERCGFKAYDYLIKYDRHVVYRLYQTGTKAGEIIKDLAGLEEGVDVSNVDDGDSLLSPWEIQNEKALEIMKSVARGTNYWLRMKPGKILYFKPKQTGSAVATIDDSMVLDAEYSEDRWKLKNRVIYVGADGEILADVSEGAGDLPVVVHDPFLTDKEEAERRANIRLALNKEYGRSLRITMHQRDFKDLGIDLGDTCTINLPSVGLNGENMVLLGIEYDPKNLLYRLEFGGRKELLEDWLDEKIGGDVAARFGQRVSVPEMISSIYSTIDLVNTAVKIQADARTVRLYNKPPLLLENEENIILDENGYAKLISGATQGSFEFSCLPESELFARWLRVHYDVEKGDGEVQVDLLRADGSLIESNIPQDYELPYLPKQAGWWTEQNASEWGMENGTLEDSRNAIISYWSVKAIQTASPMKIYYPKAGDAGWDLSKFKYLVIYLYSEDDDPDLKIRLKRDESNYLEASVNHKGGAWKRYEISISSMTKVGSPNLSQINYLEIETDLMTLHIDSDYIFIPATREQLKLKFTLTRPSPESESPRVKLAKFVWREGG